MSATPTIRVGHSPDPDDAFMFYALTFNKFDTAGEVYEHHLIDIETLNRDADNGKYEVTALSFHGYCYVQDKYILLPHGASFGDNYGPMIIAKEAAKGDLRAWLEGKTIAIPGTRTSAFLALNLWASGHFEKTGKKPNFKTEIVDFDKIIPAVAAGKYDGGLIIHEGQLTYHEEQSGRLQKIVDLGEWWYALHKLPLPLGGNGIRRDLGMERIKKVSRHLHDSIKWGLDHRQEALGYSLKYARDMGRDKADKFVGMYVNDWTLNYGEKGRQAVKLFLNAGREAGLITVPVNPEWCE